VDTDVIAAALLAEPATGDEAARFLAGRWNLHAPAHWKAELSSVLWKAISLGRLNPDAVGDILDVAETLPIASIDVATLWRGAVARALAADHPAYDVLFVELAFRLNTQVASYDRGFQRRFRTQVRAPSEFLV